MKLKKILATLTLALTLTACQQFAKPVPFGIYRGMRDGAPEGTEVFRSGWKDGCDSGLAAYGPLHYKATYDYKYDDAMLYNNEYHSAWRFGFRYCRWYVAEWTR